MSENHNSDTGDITVLLPVYIGDNADWFFEAFRSVTYNQILKPGEVLVYCDGPRNTSDMEAIS